MKFQYLVNVSQKIRATTKKKGKISLIAGLLKQIRGKEVYIAAHYLSGKLPSGKLGVGWQTVRNAIADLLPSPSTLEIVNVQAHIEDISMASGPGSKEKKINILRELFSKIGENERRFLIGLLMGEIRQGALEGLVLEAVAKASSAPLKTVRQANMFTGDIGEVAEAAIEKGSAGLEQFGPKLFHPISPMLANPAEGEHEAIERLGEASWEYKLDGARIQVHKAGNQVKIFTRHLNEVTPRIPEIVAVVQTLPLEEAIFEGEAIALRHDGKPYPFQITMRRFGRIQEIERMQTEIPLSPYFFDLLYLDGQPLFNDPLQRRIRYLADRIPSNFMIPSIITADEGAANAFFQKSLAAGHEGIMAKGLNSVYTAGQRGYHWLKIKPIRTLDLVILAAEWGHGRRKGWLSNLHLGAKDPESGQFIMLGKTFKGLTDKMLRWMTDKLLTLETHRDKHTVYVKPELVVEIAYGDLQESPRYPGGLALRFARVKGFREDKSAEEADTIQTVWFIYKKAMD